MVFSVASSIYNSPSIYESGAGGGDVAFEYKKIYGYDKFCLVDERGYIGNILSYGDTIECIVAKDEDFSGSGLGQVKFYTKKIGVLEINGLTYITTEIDGLEWTSQNMDFLIEGIKNWGDPFNEPVGIWYDNNALLYGRSGLNYGRLYNYLAAEIIKQYINDVLGNGWRIPNSNDWDKLKINAGNTISGRTLSKNIGGFSGWGTNDFSFNAVPAGYWATSFDKVEDRVVFPLYDNTSKEYYIIKENALNYDHAYLKTTACSLRLVRDVI